MNLKELKDKIKDIVSESVKLKNLHTDEMDAPVNYACIFSHGEDEFAELVLLAEQLGQVVKDTPTGPIFKIGVIPTVAGDLKILKIRKPFEDRMELGYTDFTLDNYLEFKRKYLDREEFHLTERENYEMIGLSDKEFDVFTYFAYPPIDEQLGIR